MLLLLFSILIFAAVSLVAYAVWMQSEAEKNPMTLRLRQLRLAHATKPSTMDIRRPPFLLALVARLGGFLPARDGEDALRTGLVQAGYRRPEAAMVFLGAKVVFAAALPLAWIGIAFASARPLGNTVSWTVATGLMGFYLPTFFIGLRQRQRRGQVQSALPDALDLMVVCVEAGLGVAAALHRVAVEMRVTSPVLSEELALVYSEMQAGVSRTDALRNLAERTGVEDVYSLVAMLIQTDRLGTSVAQALRTHAESMRTRRRQRAERQARKAAVKLAFPLVFLVLPALLIIILGPAAIQLMKALAANN
jgi:tight adherence protein C